LHTIDLNLFNSGAYESVKTGGKRNVGRRAFADAKIFDEMAWIEGAVMALRRAGER
jgi:hypothetical protein